MISTRLIAADGMVLMSTTSEAFTGIARRPSSSTSVRFSTEAAQVDGRSTDRC